MNVYDTPSRFKSQDEAETATSISLLVGTLPVFRVAGKAMGQSNNAVITYMANLFYL
jgi:hypothetical protein